MNPIFIIGILTTVLGLLFVLDLIFDHRPVKENMLLRVVLLCLFIVSLLILFLLSVQHSEQLQWDFWNYLSANNILRYYLIVVNLAAFVLYALDKHRAIRKGWRVPIVTLLGAAAIGGSVGSLTAMYLFRHKTRQNYFSIGVPLILVTQLFCLFFLMNH